MKFDTLFNDLSVCKVVTTTLKRITHIVTYIMSTFIYYTLHTFC